MFCNLPIARYRFTAIARQTLRMPDFAGSLLRGQFGAALRSIACMTRQPTCKDCPLQTTCPYTRIFEAVPPTKHAIQKFSAIPNSYVIEPPPIGSRAIDAGESLTFCMVLVGESMGHLALIIFAWQKALRQGLTKQRVPLELSTVEWVDEQGMGHTIWTSESTAIKDHPQTLELPAPNHRADHMIVRIQTPLRLQQQGRPLAPHQLTPRTLIAAVTRRAALMLEFHAHKEDLGAHVPEVIQQSDQLRQEISLRWYDWVRYSSRQQQEMTLGGVIGDWRILGPAEVLSNIQPWLALGQWLHVGKNATMGMGSYTLH